MQTFRHTVISSLLPSNVFTNFLTLILLVSVLSLHTTDAQIHSSVTISPVVPSSPTPSTHSHSSNSECSSLALSTCHEVQPAAPGPVRSLSSSTFTQREIGGFKCEDLFFCDDILGFEAILNLHRQLDDDADGDIDISESKEVTFCWFPIISLI